MPFSRPARVIADVLARLGIDPSERMIEGDQDPEYTSCRAEEIPRYFELYSSDTIAPEEREVLCCFLLQGLSDSIQSGEAHPLQTAIFDALFNAEELHRAELAYWMDTSDQDSENWWPITAALVAHKRDRS